MPYFGLGPQACLLRASGQLFVGGEVLHRLDSLSGTPVEEPVDGLTGLPARPRWSVFVDAADALYVLGSNQAVARRTPAGRWELLHLNYAGQAWDVAGRLPDGGVLAAGRDGRAFIAATGLSIVPTPAFAPAGLLIEASGRHWLSGLQPPFTAQLWRSR